MHDACPLISGVRPTLGPYQHQQEDHAHFIFRPFKPLRQTRRRSPSGWCRRFCILFPSHHRRTPCSYSPLRWGGIATFRCSGLCHRPVCTDHPCTGTSLTIQSRGTKIVPILLPLSQALGASIMTVTIGDSDWRRAYAILALYGVLCAILVCLAPLRYSPHLPASAALARLSPIPSTVGFCVDWMWVACPFALAAFCSLAPFKMRKGASASDLPVLLLGFVLFGLITTPLFFYLGLLANDILPLATDRLGRATIAATQSKLGLILYGSSYFIGCLVLSWLSYFLIPRAVLRLAHPRRT